MSLFRIGSESKQLRTAKGKFQNNITLNQGHITIFSIGSVGRFCNCFQSDFVPAKKICSSKLGTFVLVYKPRSWKSTEKSRNNYNFFLFQLLSMFSSDFCYGTRLRLHSLNRWQESYFSLTRNLILSSVGFVILSVDLFCVALNQFEYTRIMLHFDGFYSGTLPPIVSPINQHMNANLSHATSYILMTCARMCVISISDTIWISVLCKLFHNFSAHFVLHQKRRQQRQPQ